MKVWIVIETTDNDEPSIRVFDSTQSMTAQLIEDARDVNGDPEEKGLPTTLEEAIDYMKNQGVKWEITQRPVIQR
jgi:hypothetical protein